MNLNKIFVKQKDQQDCGVACLLSIIKYYDGAETLETLRKLSGTNTSGTTLLGLYQAASQLGFSAEGCEADITALHIHTTPLILHVLINDTFPHYVICYGKTTVSKTVKFIIGDPSTGIIYLTPNELNEIWSSKRCLVLTPNEHFKNAAVVKNEKKKWINNLLKEDINLLIAAVLIGVIITVLGMAMVIFSQRLIDDILPNKKYTKLYFGIAFLFILLILKEGAAVLRQFLLVTQSQQLNSRLINFFYSHLLKLPKAFFDTRKIGDFTARLNDTSRIQKIITQIAGNVVIDLLVTVTTLVFLFYYSWEVGLMAAAILPLYFLLIFSKRKKITEKQQAIMQGFAQSESNYISTLQGIDPIKNYNKQQLFTNLNNALFKKYQQEIFSFGKLQIRLSLVANVFTVFFLIGILLFASSRVISNQLKAGELIAILGMCSQLLPSIANLALIAIPINEAKIAFDRMFEFTGMKPETTQKQVNFINFQSIKLQDISFRFPGRSPVLKKVCFEVCKGQINAIMGENGCGKSTLVQILQKYYLEETGSIIVNNELNLRNISSKAWRQVVGVIPQNIHIFNGTVLDNIAFEDAEKNTAAVLEFLKAHGFSGFINNLPQSYMTIIGEEGINLSGGQKQFIALARALYHKPQLLILDEATSAMDRESEKFVLQLLLKLKHEMAIVFITHRLHVLKNFCSRIYLIDNGSTILHGSHEELMASTNLYSAYYQDLV